MPKKTKLKSGAHKYGSTPRKAGEKLHWTPFCRCGWRGEESGQTSAFDQFDRHMVRLKRGEES